MISIQKYKNNTGTYDFYLTNENSILRIFFGGNGDLYFGSNMFKQSIEDEFLITKENIILYNLFDNLYKDFKEAKVYKIDDFELQFYKTKEEIQSKYDEYNEWNNKLKASYMYQKLFYNENSITWISDDSISFDENKSNTLKIIKEENKYKLKFTYYEKGFSYVRSIRIRNSRSRYNPFNIVMMNFFNELQKYDPNYHQIHIEEYLYNRSIKKLTKQKTISKD